MLIKKKILSRMFMALSYIFKYFIKITTITNERKPVYSGSCWADLVLTVAGTAFSEPDFL